MTKEYKYWRCSKCGNEVLSINYPIPLQWNDGHECKYEDITQELEKEMPDYVQDMKNINKEGK